MALRSWGQCQEIHASTTILSCTFIIYASIFTILSQASEAPENTLQASNWFYCPKGWTLFRNHCYSLTEAKLSWTQSEAYCNSKGGNLVSITSQTENNFVNKLLHEIRSQQDEIWIGLIHHLNHTFHWSTGQTAVEQDGFWAVNGLDSYYTSPHSKLCCYVRPSDPVYQDLQWVLTSNCEELHTSLCMLQPCEEHAVLCEDGEKCINKAWMCDGHLDCGDGSDEANCSDGSTVSSTLESTHCGTMIKGNSGNLVSPNYPRHYPPFSNCVWKIEVPPSKVIELWVVLLDIEEKYDSLQIFDGLEISEKLLLEYFDGHVTQVKVTSTNSFVYLNFKSDHSVEASGFNITWQAVEPHNAVCGGVITATSKTQHLLFPTSYSRVFKQRHCEWLISASSSTVVNILIYPNMQLKGEDIIRIYDGPNSSYTVITELNSTHCVLAPAESQSSDPLGLTSGNIPSVIVSSSPYFFIYASLGSRNSVHMLSYSQGCDIFIHSESSIIFSPGYANSQYVNNLKCSWTVYNPVQGKLLSVVFLPNFRTEAPSDYVQVKNVSGILASMSGYYPQYQNVSSINHDFSIVFVSDSTINRGRWAAVVSEDCAPMSLLPPLILSTIENHFGIVVRFSCPQDFHLIGSSTAVCVLNGQWMMSELPSCKKIDCGPAPFIDKGYLVNISGTQIGSLAKYKCFHGYRLVNRDIAECGKGTWHNVPVCEVITCPKEPPPLHGLALAEYITFGYVREYFCEEGYQMFGSKYSHCTINGQWSDPLPVCQAPTCPGIINIPHGRANPRNEPIYIGKSVQIACDSGYTPSGPNELTCLPSLQYDLPVPLCIDIDECAVKRHTCGHHACQNLPGDYSCFCHLGYHHPIGSTKLCIDINECDINNGGCSDLCSNTDGGYICQCLGHSLLYQGPTDKRFNLVLRTNKTCIETCAPMSLEAGMNVIYSERPLSNNVYLVGTTASVQCPPGMVPDLTRINCSAMNTWRPKQPDCQIPTCEKPVPPLNGDVYYSSLSVGSHVKYSCRNGYYLTLPYESYCVKNTTLGKCVWSGPQPQCTYVQCPTPAPPVNGTVNFTTKYYNSVAIYRCLCGFQLTGHSVARCNGDGQWSTPPPICQIQYCKNPQDLTNATIVTYQQGFPVGSSVTFRCDKPGFSLSAGDTITCEPQKVSKESVLQPSLVLSLKVDLVSTSHAYTIPTCLDACADIIRKLIIVQLNGLLDVALEQNVLIEFMSGSTFSIDKMSVVVQIKVSSDNVSKVCKHRHSIRDAVRHINPESFQEELTSCSVSCPAFGVKSGSAISITDAWTCMSDLKFNNKTCQSHGLPACLEECVDNKVVHTNWNRPDLTATTEQIEQYLYTSKDFAFTSDLTVGSTVRTLSTDQSLFTSEPAFEFTQEIIPLGEVTTQAMAPEGTIMELGSEEMPQPATIEYNTISTDFKPTSATYPIENVSPQSQTTSLVTHKTSNTEPKTESPDAEQLPGNSFTDEPRGDKSKGRVDSEKDKSSVPFNVTSTANKTSCTNILLHYKKENKSKDKAKGEKDNSSSIQGRLNDTNCTNAENKDTLNEQEEPVTDLGAALPFFSMVVTDSMMGDFSNISCINISHISINTKVNEILRDFSSLMGQHWCQNSNSTLELSAGNIRFLGIKASIYINFSIVYSKFNKASIERCAKQFQEFIKDKFPKKLEKIHSEISGLGCESVNYTGSESNFTALGWTCQNGYVLDKSSFQCTHASLQATSRITPFTTGPKLQKNFIANFTVAHHSHSGCSLEYMKSVNTLLNVYIQDLFRNVSGVNISLNKLITPTFVDNMILVHGSVNFIPLLDTVNTSFLVDLAAIITRHFNDSLFQPSAGNTIDVPGCSHISLKGFWAQNTNWTYYCDSGYILDELNLKCLYENLPLLVANISLTLQGQGRFSGESCERTVFTSAQTMYKAAVLEIHQNITQHQICHEFKHVIILLNQDPYIKILVGKAQISIPVKLISLQGSKSDSEKCANQVFHQFRSALVSPATRMVQNISKFCRFYVPMPENFSLSTLRWKCFLDHQYSPVLHVCQQSSQSVQDRETGQNSKVRHKRDIQESVMWDRCPPQCFDMEPPQFQNCPGPPRFITLNNFLTRQVLSLPDVSDNSGHRPTVTYTPSVFTIPTPFPRDIQLVIKATDGAGLTATCNVHFIVEDEIPPVLNCPDVVTISEHFDGSYKLKHSLLNITYSDNSGVVTLTTIPPEGYEIPIKQNFTVTAMATDGNGNTQTCQFRLNVTPQGCHSELLQTFYGVKKNCTSYSNYKKGLICTITCPPSAIPLQTLTCIDGMWNGSSMACALDVCPKGYNKINGLCMECDVGQYQDRENSTSCLSCPSGQSTASTKSTSIQECLEMCGPNEFSTTGLKPCLPCPNGFHQPQHGSKSCQVCMNNEIYCQSNCQPGNYSVSRLSNCKPCPLNYYNKFYNTDNCMACPANQITQNVGSKNNSSCIADDCPSGSFRHNCTCFSNQTDFWCICNGSICSSDNDPCNSKPCQNHATCLSKGSNWSCQCPPGFTGPTCANKVNLSYPVPCNHGSCDPTDCTLDCFNGGNCVKNGPSSRCICVEGFSGSQCEYNINDCSMNYCLNGGICHDGINSFYCTCQEGFTGNICQTDIDDCATSPCQNNGLCQDFVNGFKCHCQTGYCGDLCEETIDLCDSQPCENGGTCELLPNSTLDYYCECTEDYTGRTCDVLTSYCDSIPCNVNGTLSCTDKDETCHCLPNWHGDLCYDYWDACGNNPCGMDICVLNPTDTTQFLCLCPLNASSYNCTAMIDLCSSSPCQNSGQCTSTGSTYLCQCSHGFTGSNCETNIDECTSQPCHHNGSCKDGINQVFCQCPLGFAGELCQIDIDECLHLPCLNAGTCTQLVGDYFCACTHDFTGKNCELKLNPCLNQPCQNDGFCQEKGSGFVCDCLPGYSGDICQIYLEDCLNTSKCLNGGKCYRHNDEDACKCTPFFVGPDCGKEQTTNYDLHFPGNQHSAVFIPPFNVSDLKELSLCVWVNVVTESTYLSLETLHLLILSLKNSNGLASIVMNNSVQLQTNDGLWHHICFTLNSSYWVVFLDGQKLTEGGNNHWPVNDSLKLTFGQKPGVMDEEWVKGHMSKFNIYSSALNESQVLNMSKSCQQTEPGDVFNWVVTQSYIQDDVDILMPSQCTHRICSSLICSSTSTEATDRTPPVVVTCPQDQIETSIVSPLAVSWTEPSFTDDVAVVKLKQNYRSGQLFDYGSYRVSYLAYDSQNNVAECSFDVFVRKTECMDLPPPQSGSRICHDWSHGRYCIPSCMTKYNFVTPTARFYRCGQEGVWDPATVFPACSRYTVANYTISGNILFEGTACSDSHKQELETKLTSITSKVCFSDSYTCGENLIVDCSYIGTDRKKRQAAELVGLYNVSIDITLVPNSNEDLGNFLVNVIPEKIVQEFKNDPDLNFTLTSVKFQTSQKCQPGQTLQNGSCVDCLAGYYAGSDNVCRPCAKGWYNDKPLQTFCIQCPVGLTTGKVGSSLISQCVGICDAGHFYNESLSICELCPLAHFQENTGQWNCQKCPPGLTTDHKGAKSAADCRNLCTGGQEVGQDGQCHLCPEGTYREDNSLSPYCIPCTLEWTTEEQGSLSEKQCTIAKCKKGFYKNSQDQTCLPCPIGTFQPVSGAKFCLPCGSGLTTEKEGADSKELCVKRKINQNTCENVCKKRNSCDTGDGLNGCSCETVQCTQTTSGDNLSETLLIVCISLTVTALVVLTVIISVCVHRKNEELKLKLKVRMYREVNDPDAFTNEGFDRQSCLEVIHTPAHIPIRLATRWHSNYLMSQYGSRSNLESTDF